MKTSFKDLAVGAKFMRTPYDPHASEKINDREYQCDVSRDTYKIFKCKPDAQVIYLYRIGD